MVSKRLTDKKCQVGAILKYTISNPAAAPAKPAKLQIPWKVAIMDLLYNACTATPCVFIDSVIRLRAEPKQNSIAINCHMVLVSPIKIKITLKNIEPNSIMALLL